MSESIFGDTITGTSFLFWTVIIYLTFLFHSWKIKEIDGDVKNTELLFLSGALGYVFLKISDYFIPVIEFIPGWLQDLKSTLSLFAPDLFIVLSFGFIYFFIYYLIFLFIAFFILKIIQYCIDPNKEILHKYHRFIILKRYKIAELFAMGIPLILLSGGVIFFYHRSDNFFITVHKIYHIGFLVNNIFIITDIWNNIFINSFRILVGHFIFQY